jgi:glycosyltransferase involved in cell wall biosynthesis
MTLMNEGPLKVLLVGPFSRYSGYGSDLIDMADALMLKGIDVYLQPINLQPPLPKGVANLLTKHLEAPFDLMIHHVDPSMLGATKEQKAATDVIVGWSMWEFSTLGNLVGRSTFKKRTSDFDALFGYSDVSVGAFQARAPKLPMGTLQGGYNDKLWPYMERNWHGKRFSFIMNGQLGLRKNPFVAIEAFAELKTEYPVEFEPAEFHLHTTVSSLPPMIEDAIPKLRVHYRTFDDYEMHEFYKSGHVLLAPSYGEGKNLPALEMLSTGGSVVATDWGGHQQWLHTQYAYPLNYELEPFGVPGRDLLNCKWAKADKDHLKALMLHCFRNREEVKQKGMTGAKLIPEMCSWDRVMDDFFRRLPDLVPGKGHEVRDKYTEAKLLHDTRKRVARDA